MTDVTLETLNKKLLNIIIVLLITGLAACSGATPSTPETPAPEPTFIPEITLVPSATLTPEFPVTQTATPTAIPTSTPTITPSATQPLLEGTPLPGDTQTISSSNASTVSLIATWNEATVSDLSWAPDGQSIAIANDSHISLVDIQTRSQEDIIQTADGLISIAFIPSGGLLASGSNPGTESLGFNGLVEFWGHSESETAKPQFEDKRGVSDVAFSPDSRWFAAAFTSLEPEFDGSVDLRDTATWEITRTITTGTVLNIAFSPDGQRLATTPDRYAIQMWRTDTNILLYTKYTSFTGAVNAIVFSPNGQNLATGHYDGEIRIWAAANGELLQVIDTGTVIESLAYSPDGTVLASGEGYFDNNINLWDTATGALLRTLEGHNSSVGSLAFSPDGQLLASGSYDGNVRLWGIGP